MSTSRPGIPPDLSSLLGDPEQQKLSNEEKVKRDAEAKRQKEINDDYMKAERQRLPFKPEWRDVYTGKFFNREGNEDLLDNTAQLRLQDKANKLTDTLQSGQKYLFERIPPHKDPDKNFQISVDTQGVVRLIPPPAAYNVEKAYTEAFSFLGGCKAVTEVEVGWASDKVLASRDNDVLEAARKIEGIVLAAKNSGYAVSYNAAVEEFLTSKVLKYFPKRYEWFRDMQRNLSINNERIHTAEFQHMADKIEKKEKLNAGEDKNWIKKDDADFGKQLDNIQEKIQETQKRIIELNETQTKMSEHFQKIDEATMAPELSKDKKDSQDKDSKNSKNDKIDKEIEKKLENKNTEKLLYIDQFFQSREHKASRGALLEAMKNEQSELERRCNIIEGALNEAIKKAPEDKKPEDKKLLEKLETMKTSFKELKEAPSTPTNKDQPEKKEKDKPSLAGIITALSTLITSNKTIETNIDNKLNKGKPDQQEETETKKMVPRK